MAKSPRHVLLETIKTAAKKVRNGAYFVKRGPIDFIAFPFAKYPRAIAVSVDSQTFLPPNGLYDAELSLTFAAEIPENPEDPGIDDGLMDQFTDDAEVIAHSLPSSVDIQGDAVALKVVGRSVEEFHDLDMRVQGVIVHLNVGW